MLKRLLSGVSLLCAGFSVQAAPPANSYLHAPLAFDRHGENFAAHGRGYVIGVNGGGARISVPDRTVTLDFAGGRKPAAVSGPELPGKVNYISGKDPRKWQIGLPTFGRVTYPEVYPGIDVVYYGNQEQLEFDLIVKPGGDPNAIRMKVGGAEKLSLDRAGALQIAGGLRIDLPKIYQEINGARKSIAGHYALVSGGEIAFRLDAYDKTRPLVVDPTLVYSSYLGGGDNTANGGSIALDSSLNILVAGYTQDQAFPAVSAAYPYNGNLDGFVTKYNATGSAILYSTYIGGTNNDMLLGIAVDATGNAWVAGSTQSNNFPVVNAVQTTFGGTVDAVLVKLSPLGVPLFSTYLGGSGNDQVLGIAVDSNANAYVTGITNSTNFPTTTGVVQTTHRGGNDIFVEKFDSSATPGRVYSTILGGTGNDEGFAVAADSVGNAYVTGLTSSAAWVPANPSGGAHATITGGQNAFVAKLNSAGTAVSYFTYFGGGSETGYSIALDSLNNVTIGGQTASSGLATSGAAQTTFGGANEGFVANLNPAGTAFNWVTYVGGNRADLVKSVALDGTGNVYLTGSTASTNLPVVSALQATIPGTTDTLFQSSDSAANFSTIDSSITDEIFDVSPDPVTSGTVVASGGGGIFLSTNNGGSWTQELTGIFGALYLARSPATSTTIYAVQGNGGARLSTNNGVTWTMPGNVGVGGMSGIVADPNTASTAYAFSGSGVYKTTNSGTTWVLASTGLPGNPGVAAMAATSDGALYAALFQGLYKSTDQAGSWSSVSAGLPGFFPSPHMLTASGTTVYVAAGRGIYKTTNGGANWSATSVLPQNKRPVEVAAAPGNPSVLYTATAGGAIYASTDGGATWSSAGTGFPQILATTIELVVDPLDPTHVFGQLLENVVTMIGKLNSTGSAFTYLTYLGSQGSGPNRSSVGYGIATDNTGNAFVLGTVSSDNFPITQDNALQTLSNNTSAFLAQISDSATGCVAPVPPISVVIPAVGFSGGDAAPGGIPVVQSSGCTWTAGSSQSWATVSGSGTGIGFVNIVSVATNATGAARTAALTLNGDTYANFTQPDISCNYTLDQSVYPIAAAGGTVTALMTTGSGCPWEVTNYYPGGVSTTTQTGVGSATLTFTVAPNGGTLARDFYLPVGPQWNDTQVHISQGTLQTISFGTLNNVTFGMPPSTIGAAATSGLTVTFVSDTTAVCAVSGVTVTFFAAGTCSITASQSGDVTYAAASPVSQSFIVLPPQTIAFGAISPLIAGTPAFALNASASSGLPVAFASNSTGICTVSGGMLTPAAAGTCSITASQSGDNATWGPAAPVTVTFTVDTTFGDVSSANESAAFITAIDDMLSKGITSGCQASPREYCPSQDVTRGQMAVFIISSIYRSGNFTYNPTPYFTDATPSLVGGFFPFIQKMRELGITSGCTPTTYCPNDNVTRGQMAVFIILARYGSLAFDFPATPYFSDATTASVGGFFKYIQRMRQDNITGGCTPTTYCPNQNVTRDQMAVFLMVGGFNLAAPTTPVLSSVSPATGGLGDTINVTLTGANTHFTQGKTTVTARAGITVGTVTVNSPTSLTVQLTIAANATPNPSSLLVTTLVTAGAEEVVLPNGFTITSYPAAGVIGYWNGNGTTANSISSMSGTLVNGATYDSASSRTQGLLDAQAFSLNGTNSYVQAAAGETSAVSGARTLAAWVYTNAFTGPGEPILTGGSDIFGITGTTGPCSGGGQYQLYVDHGGTCYVSDISLAPGVWSFVTVTFDGSRVVFYIDGVASVTVPAQMSNYGLATIEIGGNTLGGSSSGASFNGLLSEVQVYGRALSPVEIQGLYAP